MNKKIEEKERRETFERLQKRKKRKLEQQRKKNRKARASAAAGRTAGRADVQGISARASRGAGAAADSGRTVRRSEAADAGERRREGRKNVSRRRRRRRPHRFGLTLVMLQAIVSVVFLGMLQIIGIIPMKYIVIIGVLALIFFGITFATQLNRKGRAIGGKILSLFLIALTATGSFYIGKMNGVFEKTTNASYKIDNMVVAVLAKDSARQLSDTKEYTFGVQYKMGGSDVEDAVKYINEELGAEIKLVEFDSIQAQAEALHDKKVDAIIYNEGYTEHLNEAFIGYKRNVRIVYNHKIKKELSNAVAEQNIKTEPFSVYISGIDVYGEIEQTSRSDVNIIATVNPNTHQILLITTPRDYYVPIPGVSGGKKDKLTHAGNHGVDVSMATLEELYKTTIPFFVRINFTSLIEIVDQLGGVDVYSEYEFRTSRNSEHVMDVYQGINHFNGEEALAFSRERENVPGGDNQRGKNQQAVITAMIKKMISPQMLLKASGIMDSVAGNVETNMADKQIQNLIKNQLNKGGSWNIYSVAAEGEGGKDYCYSAPGQLLYVTYPDTTSIENIEELINRVENGEVLEGSDIAE